MTSSSIGHKDKEKVKKNIIRKSMPTQMLVFTQEVDYALIVRCKQSDRIFEQKHEGCVDHAICQFIGIDLEEGWCWDQFKGEHSEN